MRNPSGLADEGSPSRQAPDIEFVDATSLGTILDERGDQLVFEGPVVAGLRLMNYRTDPIRITKMELVGDPGLIAAYIGHSGCESGCPGALSFDDPSAQRMLREGIDGVYPIDVEPRSLLRTLVFKLDLDGASGVSELVSRCELHLTSVVLTLEDGSTVEVGHGSGYLAGLHLVPPLPAVASHCGSDDEGAPLRGRS